VRNPLRLFSRKVSFVREQDGPPERDLKVALDHLFGVRGSVERAYLAVVKYGSSESAFVAVCLKGKESPGLVTEIGETFAALFTADQHLDIVFVTDAQERELARVCEPFYGGSTGNGR
jgi:hypothetical protein